MICSETFFFFFKSKAGLKRFNPSLLACRYTGATTESFQPFTTNTMTTSDGSFLSDSFIRFESLA